MRLSKRPLSIVADEHIFGAEEAFNQLPGIRVSLRLLKANEIDRHAVRHADVLLTRSSTRIDARLLEGSSVRFVATATVGDDHVDKAYLRRRGIAFANAAGSSTGSVVEYVASVLVRLQAQGLISLTDAAIGVIGAGRIGSRVARMAKRLGMRVLINDPPRQQNEPNTGFVSLHALLEQADVLTIHTPLHREGPDATWHLIDENALKRFVGRAIINTARGAIIDEMALLQWLDGHSSRFAVLDCWENEPEISLALLHHPGMQIATPHIAGHSLDGKAANTWFIYRSLCRWLGIEGVWHPDQILPAVVNPIEVSNYRTPWQAIAMAVRALYDVKADDARLRAALTRDASAIGEVFSSLRRHYPPRRSWEKQPVRFTGFKDPLLHTLADALGIRSM